MSYRCQNWKLALKRHPLMVKLAEYGRELNEYAEKVGKINKAIERINREVHEDMRRNIPKDAFNNIMQAWVRPISMDQIGKYYVNWTSYTEKLEPIAYANWFLVNIRAIAKGKISNKMFPLAYFLGCVSDFDLLSLSGSDEYKFIVKSLICTSKALRSGKHGSRK